MRLSLMLLLASAATLGACTPVDTGFGEAFRWNNAQPTGSQFGTAPRLKAVPASGPQMRSIAMKRAR